VTEAGEASWADGAYRAMAGAGVSIVAYVPDAGLSRLLALCEADSAMDLVGLTDERDGIPLLMGSWLGGRKGVLLMQSSGVGNCPNMLAMANTGRFPIPMIVTMRGEWGEFNPWQVAMAQALPKVFDSLGVRTLPLERDGDGEATVAAALRLAFESDQMVAVLVRQRLIGSKSFAR
jgi:sulfopyruvate decarboxylase TPP-binding subunit